MSPHSTHQGGFTVVEVLVAIILLCLGLLAIVGTTAHTTRMIAAGRWHTQATALGRRITEALRGEPCPVPGSGVAGEGPLEARWTVAPLAGGTARRVLVTIAAPGVRRWRADTVAATVVC
jgi:type IV pilus assembly protein PilV